LISCDVRLFVGVPPDDGVVSQARGKDNVLGSRRRQRQSCERRGIHASDVGDVVEVVELRQVTVLNSVFDAHVLMLMMVILVGLSEAHSGIATLQERLMIAAASVTITAIDHPDFHRRYVMLAG